MAGKELRNLLQKGAPIIMPGAYNAFTAKLVARSFPGVYISGAGLSNSLGVPDDGTLTLDDFLYIGAWITKAVDVPVICDADTGFQNIEETVRRYIEAGFSGLHMEDQVFPKRCGHLPGKEVVPRDEMTAKIREARRTRDRYDPDFVLIARTDARGASNVEDKDQFEESVARGRLYKEAGADMIFPEALRSKDEFSLYRKEVSGYLFANMTEFGQTPFISSGEFSALGYSIVIFPVSLFRYHAGTTREFLTKLKDDGNQEKLVKGMMNRSDINALLNYKPEK